MYSIPVRLASHHYERQARQGALNYKASRTSGQHCKCEKELKAYGRKAVQVIRHRVYLARDS